MEIKEIKLEEFDKVYEDLVNLEFENEQIHFPNKIIDIENTKQIIKPIKEYIKENKAYVFLCKENNEIIGYIWCYPRMFFDEKRVYINSLIVKSEYREKGIGKKLIRKAEEKAKELGCDAIYLSAATFNERAIEFYTRNNYNSERVQLVKNLKNKD